MISLQIINKRGDIEFVAICDICKKEIVNLDKANVTFYSNDKCDAIRSYALEHHECASDTLKIEQGWMPLDSVLESLGKKIRKAGVQS